MARPWKRDEGEEGDDDAHDAEEVDSEEEEDDNEWNEMFARLEAVRYDKKGRDDIPKDEEEVLPHKHTMTMRELNAKNIPTSFQNIHRTLINK